MGDSEPILPEVEVAGQVNILKDPHIPRMSTEHMETNKS